LFFGIEITLLSKDTIVVNGYCYTWHGDESIT
jgi:hypothetical protein